MDYEAYIDAIAAGTNRMAVSVRDLDLGAPVPTCEGWNVRDLVLHMGHVQRWVTTHVRERAKRLSKLDPGIGPDDSNLSSWLSEGGAELIQVLRSTPPDTPMGVFGALGSALFWARRQAHEVSVHALDIQSAGGDIEPVDSTLASDGIDELLTTIVPLRARQSPLGLPGSLHVHCTDVEGEWTIQIVDGTYNCERTHAKGDAALRGPASTLLLVLLRRLPVQPPAQVFGDAGILEWWRQHVIF